MSGNHDIRLVVLSVLIAVFASFTALSIATRMRESTAWMRHIWLGAAAISLGGGIWSMHFVAMLAYSMAGMEMRYDLALTLASLGIALVFTGAGFAVMSWEAVSRGRILAAGLLMGIGVIAMHYLGMAAMRIPATLTYERWWLFASVSIAIGAATTAVWLATHDQKLSHRFIAAAFMGTAIAGMHYAGMQAAIFKATGIIDRTTGGPNLSQTYLAISISVITVLILFLALSAAIIEQVLQGFARREERTALRLKIADILRSPNAEADLQEIAALMGAHFGVTRAGYGQLEPSEDIFEFDVCWTDGSVKPLLGRYRAELFGEELVAELGTGRTVPINDLFEADLIIKNLSRETARVHDTRAVLVIPFVRAGRLRTIVYLSDRHPRVWARDDIVFMEELAERTRLVVERAKAEEGLRALNATLEARIDERTRDLGQAQEALFQSQKLEAVGQLVSGMAHDFNNVLTAIISAFDLVHRRPDDTERVIKYADAGLEAARRGAKLTSQLLTFARSQQIQLQPLLVCDVIRPLHDLLARTLGIAIRLELQLNPKPVPVLADATQIEMMVLNLAINARDAMSDGGLLRISTAVRAIAGDHEIADGEYVEIIVQDSGTGMDEATTRRVMEPFFTTKPVGKGTGLGLAQVYGSARQAGGTVKIESVLGEGTTVRVLLPCTDRQPSYERQVSTTAERVPSLPARVLLVDDDWHVRSLIATLLAEHGHVVVEAADGQGALAAVETAQFGIAIVDYAMPGMNGAELAKKLTKKCPKLPLIFVSGYADLEAIKEFGGNAPLLLKPFDTDDLLATIDHIIWKFGQ